ncbi:alpha/beta hydrolase [Companilactobacillus kimchiensis]|uniref:Alpha beta hydrolase domain-containing protein n=1 Tax=Companilactobacillus kimchiensis TaxID=993692 RepID=A0A0R2LLZ9_9LACO|nr:alpha/beta hydrolase [Companilactobacillus kimchiensis]KRN99709.1 alpha beta hydrolase domain-containing protein [Companilactobacillus kimchiensis]
MKHIIEVPIQQDPLIIDSDITYTQVPGWLGQTTRDLHLSIIRHPKRYDDRLYPVIFWFAGGAWMDVDYNVHLANLVDYAHQGFVIVSVEYRDSNKVKFPGQLEDAQAAINYLKKHAQDYQIDPQKIIAMGQSAGGHLASMLGVHHNVNLAIPWYGVVDPLTTMNSNLTTSHELIYQNFLGKRPDVSPTLNDRANPLKFITDKTVPFLILHGLDDQIVPVSNSEQLYQKLLDNEVPVEMYLVRNAGHMDNRFWQPTITNLVINFINQYI